MKTGIMLLIMIFLTGNVLAQTQMLVHTFQNGEDDAQLMMNDKRGAMVYGPKAITFDLTGNLYMSDPGNLKIKKFDSTYQLVKAWDFEGVEDQPAFSLDFKRIEILSDGIGGIPIPRDEHNEKRRVIRIQDEVKKYYLVGSAYYSGWTYTYSVTFLHDMAFDWDEAGKIWANPYGADSIAGTDTLPLLDYTGIQKYIADNPDKTQGISVDDKQRLFYNGELFTRSWAIRRAYLVDTILNLETDNRQLGLPPQGTSPYMYLGEDIDKNEYWFKSGVSFFVINKEGFITYYLNVSKEPAPDIAGLHPSGDLYFLGSKPYTGGGNDRTPRPEPTMELYKISRTW